MNYTYNVIVSRSAEGMPQLCRQDLEEQVKTLTEWKKKAMIQLEYFRTACRMYNLCDVAEVNKLLSN